MSTATWTGVRLWKRCERSWRREHAESGWVVDAYVEHFGQSLGPIIDGSARLLAELSDRGTRCVGLSNWSAVTFNGIPQRYPELDLLEGILISGDVGLLKPDPEIFVHCEELFGFSAEQAVFIDDSGPNVRAARERGWDAVLFEGPEKLRGDLERRLLL